MATTSLYSSTTHSTRLVAPRVTADPALLVLGDVEADRAELHALLDLEQHLGEPAYVGGLGLEQVERDPLGALGTDAGQTTELVDEVLDDAFVQGGAQPPKPGTPPGASPPPRPGRPPPPPASGPRALLARASAWDLASR